MKIISFTLRGKIPKKSRNNPNSINKVTLYESPNMLLRWKRGHIRNSVCWNFSVAIGQWFPPSAWAGNCTFVQVEYFSLGGTDNITLRGGLAYTEERVSYHFKFPQFIGLFSKYPHISLDCVWLRLESLTPTCVWLQIEVTIMGRYSKFSSLGGSDQLLLF